MALPPLPPPPRTRPRRRNPSNSPAAPTRPALVNGLAGLVNTVDDQLVSVMSFTVSNGGIATIDILSDPDRLARLNLRGEQGEYLP